MLKSDDKIFKNLYNELGWDIENAIKSLNTIYSMKSEKFYFS